jgi:HSP20 family protein
MKGAAAVTQTNQPNGIEVVSPTAFFDEASKRFDAIARRAFELFESNGHNGGHALEDWLKAESEIFHPVHVEIAEADGALTVKAEVPGFTDKDLKISVEPNRLTISGKREGHSEKKSAKTLYTESCSDEILRVIDLPAEVDPSAKGVQATCTQGVLTVTLPEVAGPKVRQIKIEA